MTRRSAAPLATTVVALGGARGRRHRRSGGGSRGAPGTRDHVQSGVEVVTVTAAVRDRRGRVVRDLKQADFEVIDPGDAREMRDFYSGEAPISLAVLLDISGSMAVGGNMDRARHAVDARDWRC